MLVVGVLAYFSLVALLRVSGKRTLSKLNAFDLVVTVAIGSTLATVLLSRDVALVEGVLAFVVLIGLQFVVSWTSLRFPRFQEWITSEPRLVVRNGQILRRALRIERITEEEVLAAIRGGGYLSLEKVAAVVIETDGSFSILPESVVSSVVTLRGRVRTD